MVAPADERARLYGAGVSAGCEVAGPGAAGVAPESGAPGAVLCTGAAPASGVTADEGPASAGARTGSPVPSGGGAGASTGAGAAGGRVPAAIATRLNCSSAASMPLRTCSGRATSSSQARIRGLPLSQRSSSPTDSSACVVSSRRPYPPLRSRLLVASTCWPRSFTSSAWHSLQPFSPEARVKASFRAWPSSSGLPRSSSSS